MFEILIEMKDRIDNNYMIKIFEEMLKIPTEMFEILTEQYDITTKILEILTPMFRILTPTLGLLNLLSGILTNFFFYPNVNVFLIECIRISTDRFEILTNDRDFDGYF